MPQITLYLDEDTDVKARAAAKAAGVSYSRWVAELIRGRVERRWPESVRALAGAIRDFPDAAELRAGIAPDLRREQLG
jgi:hypothetical protein